MLKRLKVGALLHQAVLPILMRMQPSIDGGSTARARGRAGEPEVEPDALGRELIDRRGGDGLVPIAAEVFAQVVGDDEEYVPVVGGGHCDGMS